ncbi:MAG: porphobilinogen synthase, partial [Rhodospirillales bacterium]|nr:porphobilinogen synthase [Rhodospirillales bacterium]
MNFPASFPATRMRRNRRDAWTRKLVAENTLTPGNLIWPIFLTSGENQKVPVESMPGVFRVSVDRAAEHVAEAVEL